MIYLDNDATTPVDARARDAMLPFLEADCGNPASREHAFGWKAAEAVDEARGNLAALINSRPDEILFTSGATESINAALKGLLFSQPVQRILTSAAEHQAVLECCQWMESHFKMNVACLPVDRAGKIELSALESALRQAHPSCICLMLANNEIGNIHPVRQVAEFAHAAGALFFSDITQAAGKIPVDVRAMGIDLAAFSAHKLYGPKGVGALFIRSGEPRIELEPLIVGGGQERGLRAGTLNVPGIVGFGEACRIAKLEMAEESKRVGRLRDKLENSLLAEIPDIWINGDRQNRLPNTTNIGFRGVDARTLIRDMHDIAVSTKSACSSGQPGPSHVLKAIGLTDDEAYSCIRFSLGRFTTEQEIDYAIAKVVASVRKLRASTSSSTA